MGARASRGPKWPNSGCSSRWPRGSRSAIPAASGRRARIRPSPHHRDGAPHPTEAFPQAGQRRHAERLGLHLRAAAQGDRAVRGLGEAVPHVGLQAGRIQLVQGPLPAEVLHRGGGRVERGPSPQRRTHQRVVPVRRELGGEDDRLEQPQRPERAGPGQLRQQQGRTPHGVAHAGGVLQAECVDRGQDVVAGAGPVHAPGRDRGPAVAPHVHRGQVEPVQVGGQWCPGPGAEPGGVDHQQVGAVTAEVVHGQVDPAGRRRPDRRVEGIGGEGVAHGAQLGITGPGRSHAGRRPARARACSAGEADAVELDGLHHAGQVVAQQLQARVVEDAGATGQHGLELVDLDHGAGQV